MDRVDRRARTASPARTRPGSARSLGARRPRSIRHAACRANSFAAGRGGHRVSRRRISATRTDRSVARTGSALRVGLRYSSRRRDTGRAAAKRGARQVRTSAIAVPCGRAGAASTKSAGRVRGEHRRSPTRGAPARGRDASRCMPSVAARNRTSFRLATITCYADLRARAPGRACPVTGALPRSS